MTNAPTTGLGRQCIRLSVWADAVPPHARAQVAARLDTLAALLGQLCADTADDDGTDAG